MQDVPILDWCRRYLGEVATRQLVEAYGEKHRHYHTWSHIESMWKHLVVIPEYAEHTDAIRLAVLFHDVVYSTQPQTYGLNEVRSAQALRDDVRASSKFALEEVELAAAIIEATKTHRLDTSVWDSQSQPAIQAAHWVLDADMAVLASADDELETYDTDIAREWGYRENNREHALLFAKGRIQALLGMMMQWPVFHSNEFSHLEKPAVRNMERLVLKWKQVQTALEQRSLCEKP